MVNCVDCHLPPTDNTWEHYSAKAALGMRDLWGGYLTKDTADFDWDKKIRIGIRCQIYTKQIMC